MLSYPNTDIVRMAVDTVGFEAFAFGATALHLPQMGRNAKFGAELGDRAVDGNTAHDGNNRLNFVFVLFDVRHRKQTR